MIFDTKNATTAAVIQSMAKLNGMPIATLAFMLHTSQQNLGNKLRRNNFSENELRRIAEVLGYRLVIRFEQSKAVGKENTNG